MREILIKIFAELHLRIERENKERRESGTPPIPRSEVIILGQTSLLAQPELTHHLTLAQTGDLNAKLKAQHFVKRELRDILPGFGLIYDELSEEIFIPKGSKYSKLLELQYLLVKIIDPESALVSKAVKAPEKNRQLIRQAIATEEFPELAERIVSEGGKLENFV